MLLASLGLGMALAFVLGGRKAAGALVSGAYGKAQQQSGQVKQDLQTGKQRGQAQAEKAKNKLDGNSDSAGNAASVRTRP